PRISFMRNERPFLGGAAYFSVGTEFVTVLRESRSKNATTDVTTVTDSGLSRFDVNPTLRYPFKKWQWFTVNSTVSWRDTYYSRSMTPVDPSGAVPQKLIDDSLNRRFVTVQSQIVGPVFNRIWDTPTNGYAEKF